MHKKQEDDGLDFPELELTSKATHFVDIKR